MELRDEFREDCSARAGAGEGDGARGRVEWEEKVGDQVFGDGLLGEGAALACEGGGRAEGLTSSGPAFKVGVSEESEAWIGERTLTNSTFHRAERCLCRRPW